MCIPLAGCSQPTAPGNRAIPRSPAPQTSAQEFADTHERWAVKTGEDSDAGSVVARPVTASVAQLTSLTRPLELPQEATTRAAQDSRYGPAEHAVYTIDADIVRYKLEKGDHDYHLVLVDHGDNAARPQTMIAEIPDPELIDTGSRWRDSIAATRAEFSRRFSPGGRFVSDRIHAAVTGIGFFDFLHHQSGVAPNGIELHPVLSIRYAEADSAPESATDRNGADTYVGGSGNVWVNTRTGVYWRPGSRWYGRTSEGRYTTESEAQREGDRPAER